MRSLIYRAALKARETLNDLPQTKELREALANLQSTGFAQPSVRVTESQLSQSIVRLPRVRDATVVCGERGIAIELTRASGIPFECTVSIVGVSFAPRGPKEISFELAPSGATRDSIAPDLVIAIADRIARATWGPLFFRSQETEPTGVVDRTQSGLTIDLRTLGCVRALPRGIAPIMDAFTLKRCVLESGAIKLEVGPAGLR